MAALFGTKKIIEILINYFDFLIQGQPSHGIRENINNITEEDVLNYVKTNYVGANFVVAAAGNVNADAFLKAAETAFSTVP